LAVLKRASGVSYWYGGESHSGWLPPGAAIPLPTPVRHLTLDVTIEGDGGTGYIVVCTAREEPAFGNDNWFANMAEAEAAAEAWFGIEPERWQDAWARATVDPADRHGFWYNNSPLSAGGRPLSVGGDVACVNSSHRGSEAMSKVAKILDRVLRGTSDANIRFDDLLALLVHLGFVERVRGDHHIFTRDDVPEILNLQPRGSQAKAYQVKQVRGIIVTHRLAADPVDEPPTDGSEVEEPDRSAPE
jgi:hypothetical protein